MSARPPVLPPAFSLLRSEFNDFLFAPVGDEKDDDHRPLTVLSAFAREGLDPWQEAARLRELPREQATQDLASMLAALSDRPRSLVEAQFAADRLIALLPPMPPLKKRLSTAARRVRTNVTRAAFVDWVERVLGRN